MQLKRLLLIFSAFILLTNCSKDDTIIDDPLKELDPNVITNSLIIEAATKKSGDAPAPTTTGPTFELITDQYTAIGEAAIGFDLKFKTDDDFAGLYLQIKGANSYFDIPASSADALRTMSSNSGKSVQREVDNFQLPIGILEIPETGEICAFICVYDNDNNISVVEEFCINIVNWGSNGNNDLVGKWRRVKIDTYQDNVLVYTDLDGELWENYSYANDDKVDCVDNPSELELTVKEYAYFEYFADGSFIEDILFEIVSSTPECDLNDILNEDYGFWAFDPTNNNIIDLYSDSASYDILNFPYNPNYGSELYSDLIVSLNSSNLAIKTIVNDTRYKITTFEKYQ